MQSVKAIEGELLRFYVKSRTAAGVSYLVDLQSLKCNGECGCDQFNFRCRPELNRRKVPSDRSRCWHIHAARQWLLDKMIIRLADFHGEQKRERKLEYSGP